jgi:murein endopeptidase
MSDFSCTGFCLDIFWDLNTLVYTQRRHSEMKTPDFVASYGKNILHNLWQKRGYFQRTRIQDIAIIHGYELQK